MKLTQPLNYTETVYEGWAVLRAACDGETRFSCVSLLAVRWLLLAPAAPTATTVLSTLHRSSNDVHPASGKQDVDIDVTARAQGG